MSKKFLKNFFEDVVIRKKEVNNILWTRLNLARDGTVFPNLGVEISFCF